MYIICRKSVPLPVTNYCSAFKLKFYFQEIVIISKVCLHSTNRAASNTSLNISCIG
jgi:hypothetical protein